MLQALGVSTQRELTVRIRVGRSTMLIPRFNLTQHSCHASFQLYQYASPYYKQVGSIGGQPNCDHEPFALDCLCVQPHTMVLKGELQACPALPCPGPPCPGPPCPGPPCPALLPFIESMQT